MGVDDAIAVRYKRDMFIGYSNRLPCEHGHAKPVAAEDVATTRACRRCGQAWSVTRSGIVHEWRLTRMPLAVRKAQAARFLAKLESL